MKSCDINVRYSCYGRLGAILWVLCVGCVQAGELKIAGSNIQFDNFELELPIGLNGADFYVPADNPINKEKVELGRTLFFDVRLSSDNTVSCATCHPPQTAFADSRPVSLGIAAQAGVRNAPSIINRAFSREQFWDGHASSLEEQAKLPLINSKEMGMPSHEVVIEKIRAIKGYNGWFNRVFARDATIDDLAKAIAAFERTVVSGNSKFDEFKAGNRGALSESEKRGMVLFEGKARCSQCHSGPNFTDEKYHNLGIDWDGVLVDLGRYRVTNNEQEIGAFKTPTLREIAHTAPYMHNGSMATLEETMDFYNSGGIANPFLDNEMKRPNRTLEQMLDYYEKEKKVQKGRPHEDDRGAPVEPELVKLNLTTQEQADLVAFLRALSGQGWQQIAAPDSFPE